MQHYVLYALHGVIHSLKVLEIIQVNLGIGKDAFLSFINTSSRWNDSSVEGIIKYLFDGSTSDGSNGSIYYEIQNIDKLIKYGNITLPKSPNKQQLSVIVIVGIVIGSVVFVITTIVIIVIIVQCRKRKSKSGYLRNISSFHDPLGSYRSL
ncbi:MAG: hypothetical protein EZS28_018624 [Streblomastix strix]|uniref:Uncharacterized protein n=1 Tax=Streblomastix strix TaxID=222440 RepID=A0A5J4VTT8_9EUKA|nr:MAG: hypothetical protein EZS28_018624 [Streblomastix strix]